MDIVEDLYTQKRYLDIYILSRFMYRVGSPMINDRLYDALHNDCVRCNILPEYTSRSYDDDPVPYKLLQEFNLDSFIPKTGSLSRYAKYLDEEKSLSILAVTNIDEVYNFVKENNGQDMVLSLKVDGVNIKNLYVDNNLELSMSRGRKGQGFDVTLNSLRVLPKSICDSNMVKVFTEMAVPQHHLAELQKRYNKDKYKTPKSSAISMLRVKHAVNDYSKLCAYAFNAEGIECDTKVELLNILKNYGFTTVPFVKINNKDIPVEKSSFHDWFMNLADDMYFKYKHIPSDGLVLELNNLNLIDSIHNQYSNRNIAVKLGYWKFDCYQSVVTNIIFEQQRINKNCRINIEPVLTNDGSTVSFVNGYNPSIIIENGINIGSTIKFERHSNTVSNLVLEEEK